MRILSVLVAAASAWAAGTDRETCREQLTRICPQRPFSPEGSGVSLLALTRLQCLRDTVADMDQECFFLAQLSAAEALEAESPLKKQCGKRIDEWKKQVKNKDIAGVITASLGVTECLASNAKSLWEHCKPKRPSTYVCKERALEWCPPSSHKALGLGYSMACIRDHVADLGLECATEAVFAAVERMDNDAAPWCRQELRQRCGQGIDSLELSSSAEVLVVVDQVTECIAANAQTLWEKCSQSQEEPEVDLQEVVFVPDLSDSDGEQEGGSKKPTKKQTHKPSPKDFKAPTKKPTHKPTKHHIVQELAFFPQLESYDSLQAATMEVNLDACVLVARRMCAQQAEKMDANLLDDDVVGELADCLNRNLDAIEAGCKPSWKVVDSSSGVDQYDAMWYRHEPCKHHAGEVGSLPMCGQEHQCGMGLRQGLILGLSVLACLLAMSFLRLVCQAVLFRGAAADEEGGEDLEADSGGKPLLANPEKA
ncbi:hypothetical protein BASA81_000448 [Batrachochytrium salamandrivorans]|nr:hypothetical protein BASA81_000448 [Batrachochytrium salamandrivorans]